MNTDHGESNLSSVTLGRVSSLIHMSGRQRGRLVELKHQTYHLVSESDQFFILGAEPKENQTVLAHLHPSGDSFELEIKADNTVRLNGTRIVSELLDPGDVIEVENPAVLLKFDLISTPGKPHINLGALFNDCVRRTRFEAKSRGGFLARLPVNVLVDLTESGSLKFRVLVSVSLIVLVTLSLYQWYRSLALEQQVIEERQSLEGLSEWFKLQQEEFISREELEQINLVLHTQLTQAQERVSVLETKSGASQRIISQASRAVIFLQGAWVYQQTETGRKLRYMVTDKGYPLMNQHGEPLTSIDGNGPVVSKKFTGTAFVISGDGQLMTNRHVVKPWEQDPAFKTFSQKGIEPVFEKFVGYLPDVIEPFAVAQSAVSEFADLAILQCSGITEEIPHIPIATDQPAPGEEVLVLGYPTGLRALLARSDTEYIRQIAEQKLDFWTIASGLSQRNLIRPLASRGIIGQVSHDAIALDADTTQGGSGGPVLNSRGELVAVINAILPEYGGSNLGVPVNHVLDLIQTTRESSF